MIEHLYPHMVHECFVEKMRKLSAARNCQRAKIRTKDDVLRLRQAVRRKLAQSFGRFPEKTPLNPRITGKVERALYTIEKIIFESRPELFVTANLYIPAGLKDRAPCVLAPCGHSAVGKAEPKYQFFVQNLARKGYLVLIYDPLSQGERIQYPFREGRAHPEGCCQEHNMMGNQMSLIGEAFCKWRLWDGIRALDYLLSRPEADPARVGVTGNSGGGTLTTYLNAFDGRFTMAAPSCFITTYLCNLENELPSDSEQIPPNIIKYGLDIADFIVAQIPRPVLLLGQQNDFFDLRGLRKTYEELKRLYAIMGAGKDFELFVGPRDHGYFPENRRAMYVFFNKHSGVRADDRETGNVAEIPKRLACTPEGQVYKMGGKRVFDFTREHASRINRARKAVPAPDLAKIIRKVLAVENRPEVPYYRVLRPRGDDAKKYPCHSSFAVETEPGLQSVLHFFGKRYYFYCPQFKKAALYVPHVSSQADIAAGLAPASAQPLFALDVRGMGQTMALTCASDDFFAPYGSDYLYASYADMFGEPYLGRRVRDLMLTLNLLRDRGCREVHLMGRGLGALIAVFAACLHPLVKKITLKNTLLSYYELTQTPVNAWPLSFMPRDILHYFDLPDCYRALAAKHLKIIAPWNSRMDPLTGGRSRKRAKRA
ncbi:MAG: acetylxylan esterase [Kiritimatiellae bacterium]|nr:acetylxylan esterase [Kiritimatiellia bacterium]